MINPWVLGTLAIAPRRLPFLLPLIQATIGLQEYDIAPGVHAVTCFASNFEKALQPLQSLLVITMIYETLQLLTFYHGTLQLQQVQVSHVIFCIVYCSSNVVLLSHGSF